MVTVAAAWAASSGHCPVFEGQGSVGKPPSGVLSVAHRTVC